jgi:hypothetical protein
MNIGGVFPFSGAFFSFFLQGFKVFIVEVSHLLVKFIIRYFILVGDIASDFFLSLFMESVEVPDKQ